MAVGCCCCCCYSVALLVGRLPRQSLKSQKMERTNDVESPDPSNPCGCTRAVEVGFIRLQMRWKEGKSSLVCLSVRLYLPSVNLGARHQRWKIRARLRRSRLQAFLTRCESRYSVWHFAIEREKLRNLSVFYLCVDVFIEVGLEGNFWIHLMWNTWKI